MTTHSCSPPFCAGDEESFFWELISGALDPHNVVSDTILSDHDFMRVTAYLHALKDQDFQKGSNDERADSAPIFRDVNAASKAVVAREALASTSDGLDCVDNVEVAQDRSSDSAANTEAGDQMWYLKSMTSEFEAVLLPAVGDRSHHSLKPSFAPATSGRNGKRKCPAHKPEKQNDSTTARLNPSSTRRPSRQLASCATLLANRQRCTHVFRNSDKLCDSGVMGKECLVHFVNDHLRPFINSIFRKPTNTWTAKEKIWVMLADMIRADQVWAASYASIEVPANERILREDVKLLSGTYLLNVPFTAVSAKLGAESHGPPNAVPRWESCIVAPEEFEDVDLSEYDPILLVDFLVDRAGEGSKLNAKFGTWVGLENYREKLTNLSTGRVFARPEKRPRKMQL